VRLPYLDAGSPKDVSVGEKRSYRGLWPGFTDLYEEFSKKRGLLRTGIDVKNGGRELLEAQSGIHKRFMGT
jgi:hypothetical protein